MVKETFNEEHAERSKLRLFDVVSHFYQMSESCGNVANELLESFTIQAKLFNEMVATEISGCRGEEKAYKSLQTIRIKHKLLKNIELKVGEHKSELDFIVITNSGVYIIEVKNTSKDIVIDEKGNYLRVTNHGTLSFDKNIGEKMNDKEFLLRETLASAGIDDVSIHSLVVFTNSNIQVTNNYKYITECFLSQLPHIINNNKGAMIDDKKMNKLEKAILDAQYKEAYSFDLDIAKFKESFATLVVTLEETKKKQAELEYLESTRKKNWFARFSNSIARVACSIFK